MLVVSTPEECHRCFPGGLREGSFVVTIGNFDGVHLGHQALVRRAVQCARELGRRALVATFDPHPARVLSPHAPLTLTNTEQRLELLRDLGVDVTLLIPFTRDFAAMTAGEFCREVLSEQLGTRELFVGYDFHMGRDQANAEDLAACGRKVGIRVTRVDAVLFEGAPVSSTRIRNALAKGDLALANAMLGRPHAVRGIVVRGAGRGGALLGFPTANVDVQGCMMPKPAVYATSARLVTGSVAFPQADHGQENPRRTHEIPVVVPVTWMPAVTSLGRNPTFEGVALTLETYILDFSADIYGGVLDVVFLKTLRGEKKFSGPEELVRQLQADVAARRAMEEKAGAPQAGSERFNF